MNYQKITITMTTVKRFELFKKTIESFFDCCNDTNLIQSIIIADDGSDPYDIEKMRKILNNYKIPSEILKKVEKGHWSSMNLLWNKVNTNYSLHLEDDWLFTKKSNFIRNAFDVMFEDESIKQVLFRVNPEIMAVNQKFSKTKKGLEYIKYEYDVKSKDIMKRPAWSGFNLNPSLINIRDVKNKIGLFNNMLGFEYNYSMRYAASGFKVAYFFENTCEHIGKGFSAYDENQTAR